jgi:hypothetical protein
MRIYIVLVAWIASIACLAIAFLVIKNLKSQATHQQAHVRSLEASLIADQKSRLQKYQGRRTIP